MKQTLKRIIRTVKSVKGNSLAEFATTTALMATLAATAAPKLSEMSEGAKAEKSRNELDKLVKQAGQFYQDAADIEVLTRCRYSVLRRSLYVVCVMKRAEVWVEHVICRQPTHMF